MVSERLHPRQEMVASDWVGISDPRKIPSRWRSVTADRPYSFSGYGGAPVDRPYSSGYGGAPADRPSSLSGYGGAPAVRPSSLSGYGGAPAVRPSSLSGYGGGPNRCLVKVPGSTPGKIPNPSSNLGKMTKWVVRYEEDASDPTAVWRIATAVNHKADMGQQQRGDFQKVMTGLKESMNRVENLLQRLANLQDRGAINLRPIEEPRNVSVLIQPREMARRTEDLRQISLNDTQEIQSVSIPEGNLHFPSTDLSEVVTGWGEDPLPHDFIAFPHLNNLNPSHGPEMAKDMEKGVSAVAKKHAQNDIVGQNMNLTTAARGKLLNEAQFDLAQLYMGKRADKKLRGTGLFWKTPPWPDFCIEELKAVYKSELMEMRHEVEEERMILQMARVWRVERVQRKLVVAKLTVDSKYALLNKLQSDLEEFLSFHQGNSVDEEIHKSAEESGDSRIAKKCLRMLRAMRSHHEYNYVAYRKGIGVVCNKKGGFGVDDRWLWSTGLLWNLPPWPDLSLCEADGMAMDIEKGAAAMCLRMAAMFGGIVGQEVVQACSGKFHPVYQFFYFDSSESLPVEPSESGDLKPENTRYTAPISVFGSKLQKKLEQAKIFTVGSGALGCEVLKNLALMGISCSPDGKLTVTDDDVIEQSNISRQFLVHDWNSGQPKPTVAATIVMAINSKDYVEAQMLPKSHYCYLIRLTLEYCKFSSLDAHEITKESRRRLSNSFGEIRYCFNDVGLLCASEAIKICIERGQKRGWLKGASDATYQQSGVNGLCLFAEISALHMKFFEEVLHLIVKRLQQGIEAFLNSESGCVGATKMGYIFQKLYELIQIFYSFCNFDHVRRLIFVNQEIIAKIIGRTMQKMGHLSHYTIPFITGGSFSVDVLEVVGQNYSDFVLNITSKKLKPGVPSEKNPQGVISETRYPADNWNSCQFALSNGSPVHNNQSVSQSGLSYGDNDLSYIDWPGIDNFEEDNTLFRCDSTYGQQQLENTEELSWILSSSDAIYSSDVALQPGFEPPYSDYGILDDLSAFNCTHDKSLPIADPSAAVYDKLYTLAIRLKVHSLTMERVTYGFSAGDWVRHKEEDQKRSQVGILHSIDRNGTVYVGWIRLDTCWKGGYSDLQVAEAYSVEQFVRLEVNISNPHFEWQRKNGGGISTDRISKIFSNGCLVVNFTIKFIFGKVWSCLADRYEVEVVSFCKCEGIVKKQEHLEDFHWAVRPLLITICIFVGKSITGPKGLKVASVSDQGGDHQQLHQQEVQKQYQCSMIPSTGGKHTFLRRSCAFWIKVNDGKFLKHLGYATPQIDPG